MNDYRGGCVDGGRRRGVDVDLLRRVIILECRSFGRGISGGVGVECKKYNRDGTRGANTRIALTPGQSHCRTLTTKT